MLRFLLACLLGLGTGLAAARGPCDLSEYGPGDSVRIVLQDERVFRMKIEEISRSKILGDVFLGTVSSPMEIRCYEIYRMEKIADLGVDEAEEERVISPGDLVRSPGDDEDEDDGAGIGFERYIAVPVRGPIGITTDWKDDGGTIAPGLDEVLKFARRKKVELIVFEIDSPGGLVKEASALAELLLETDEEFTTVAVVKRSISAANWVTFACDYIVCEPGATLGGALAYLSGGATPEFDAKINSITAAELRSIAERKGHDPLVADAATRPELTVYWQDGRLTSGEALPDGARMVAPAGQVATFDAADLAELGYPTMRNDPVELAGLARADRPGVELRLYGKYGDALMDREVKKLHGAHEKRLRAIEDSIDLLKSASTQMGMLRGSASAAQGYNPAAGQFYYSRDTGRFTSQSLELWRRNHDHAIGLWQEVSNGANRLCRTGRDFDRLVNRTEDSEVYWSLDPEFSAALDAVREVHAQVLPTLAEACQLVSSADRAIGQLRVARQRTAP